MIASFRKWFCSITVILSSLQGYSQTHTPIWPETFEKYNKKTYSYDTLSLNSGSWIVNDAIIGNSNSDRKNGGKSLRIQNNGFITMNFDIMDSPNEVSFYYGRYGNDAPSMMALYSSIDSGKTWIKYKNNIHASSILLTSCDVKIAHKKPIRFQIRKISGGRLNIDDINITNSKHIIYSKTTASINPKAFLPKTGSTCICNNDTIPTRDDNMAMGNPSNATTSTTDSNNYLMIKPQFTLSYNNQKGEPNWVSWHLSSAWKGNAARCNCFASDSSLPSGYFKAPGTAYSSSGFDRGHLCPSEDRDSTDADNRATFLMSNMTPQAPVLNQQVWAALETYCRKLITQGNELYIIAGGYSSGGTGSNGGLDSTIDNGKINVYAHYWKVVVVLPTGSNDVSRVSNSTRVIAIDLPNNQQVNAHTWDYYRVTVHSLETATGFNFLSNVSSTIQSVIEAIVDNGATN